MKTTRVTLLLATLIVCIAGVALAQTEWVDHPDNPVIGFEDPGPWAPSGPSNGVVVIADETYHLWFSGLEEGDVTGIGHATSPDGLEWTMDPANPVLNAGPDGNWDDYLVLGGAVIHDGTTFHMWYTASSGPGEPDHVGYATSLDGSTWTKYADNPVMEPGPPGSWDSNWLGPTAVIADGETYRMWYNGSSRGVADAKVGYAESPDGLVWTKHPDPVLVSGEYPGAWEVGLLNPSVVFHDGTYHMWYAGDNPADYTKAGYAYSTDGIRWTKHRGNPVHVHPGENILGLSVHWDETGWRMWYSTFKFPELVAQEYFATSECCDGEAALDSWRFIPAAAVASGAQGAFFQTDVDLSNADDRAAQYEISWLPRGDDNSVPMTSELFNLEAGMSVRYANVLAEVFDLEPDSLGALLIKSTSPDLLGMSRTYNTPGGEPAGTYGQAIPAVSLGALMATGERRRILFASDNAEMRTNIGCQSASDGTTVVNVELFDSEGTSLERTMMILRSWGNDQLNRPFEDYAPVDGYVEVWTDVPNRQIYCYGSVLDNTTSDPTTIPPQ